MLRVLEGLDLDRYGAKFAEEKVSLAQLPGLTNEDLKDMGVPLGHRKRMLEAFGTFGTSCVPRSADAAGAEIPKFVRITELREKPSQGQSRAPPPIPCRRWKECRVFVLVVAHGGQFSRLCYPFL